MILTTEQRPMIFEKIMRTADCPGGISKPQLLAVVAAIDDWWETASLDGNAAIPQPQRGLMTKKQKARLFVALLEARYEVT